MARLIFHIDVGDLPQHKAEELVNKIKEDNRIAKFLRPGETATYISNRKGFTSVEILPEVDKKYILAVAANRVTQAAIDTFFGPNKIMVVETADYLSYPSLIEVQV